MRSEPTKFVWIILDIKLDHFNRKKSVLTLDGLQLVCRVVAAIGGAKLGTVNGTNNICVDVEARDSAVLLLATLFLLLQLQAATTT